VSTPPVLPYGRQQIDDDDIAAVVEALKSDWLTSGPKVAAFEDALAEKVGAAHAVSCSSGTAGLHLAAVAVGLGPGDRAVVPSLTFLATANAVRHAGAEVVFADVDPDTGLMRPNDLEAALERAGGPVRAVLPVHLNGQCVDIPGTLSVAARHGAAVIFDAAHAIGAGWRDGDKTLAVGNGRHGAACVFSFHPVKTICMGEGGAVTTDDDALAERLRRFRNHGMSRDPATFENAELAFDAAGDANPWYYEMAAPGFNYRASDLHCALGLSQLAKLDGRVARRARLVTLYDEALAPLAPRVRPLGRAADSDPAWHLYVALIDFDAAGIERAAVMARLRDAGIATMVHYLPLHLQPYYRRDDGPDLPGALAYYRRALTLPLFPAMADDDVARVVDTLATALRPD